MTTKPTDSIVKAERPTLPSGTGLSRSSYLTVPSVSTVRTAIPIIKHASEKMCVPGLVVPFHFGSRMAILDS